MTITYDFFDGPIPTTPDDTSDPPRFGQPIETTKDAFIIELRKFFNRANITSSRLEEIPTIRKYDVSIVAGENSLETAVKLIQKFPNIKEDLPLIAVLGANGRNLPMGIGGQYVATVSRPSFILGANTEPFALADGQTLIYKTTSVNNDQYTSTIIFRSSRFQDITQATANEIISEIDFQALYAKSANSSGKVLLQYGGPGNRPNILGDIEIVGGTAAIALGFTIGQNAKYKDSIPYRRYHQATYIDIAIEVVSEDSNIRTELTDLLWSFFTLYMDGRDYTFLGRSIFDYSIPNETYQVIIKPDPAMSGEQEVPRPGDEVDKIYVNRINVPVTTIQYIDRAVFIPGTTTPFYVDSDSLIYDDTIPEKN